MEVFHHPAMVGNIDHKQQLNPICFCKSDGSELYRIFLQEKQLCHLKPSLLISLASSVSGRQSAQMQNNCLLQDCSDKHKWILLDVLLFTCAYESSLQISHSVTKDPSFAGS